MCNEPTPDWWKIQFHGYKSYNNSKLLPANPNGTAPYNIVTTDLDKRVSSVEETVRFPLKRPLAMEQRCLRLGKICEQRGRYDLALRLYYARTKIWDTTV